MSIFRNSSHTDLSALVDDELGPRSVRSVTDAVHRDPEAAEALSRVRRVHRLLERADVDADVAAAQARVRDRLARSLPHGAARPRTLWDRSLTVPVPIAVAAVLVLALTVVFVVTRGPAAGDASSVSGIARGAESLNLQVHVDATDTDELLQWLNDQQHLETVTIELPDSAQFQLRGEPVMLRPGLAGESPTDDDEAPTLTPIEPEDAAE